MSAADGARPSYASGTGDVPLLGDTIGQNLRRSSTRHPQREALVDVPTGRRWTYAQLQDDVDALAAGLVGLGVEQGDRVGIWAGNCPEWLLLQYATAEIGAILVSLNPAYRSHELGYVLAQSGVRLLVAAREMKGVDSRPILDDAVALNATPTRIVLIGDVTWEALLDRSRTAGEEVRRRAALLSPDDPINIQYTSGTTGHPKGATLSHHNVLNNAFFVGERLGYTGRDRICVPVPLFHTFGMVLGNLAATSHAACLVYAAEFFDPRATLDAVGQERCTAVYGVPTMFIAMLAVPDLEQRDLGSLRTGIMAGSPCPIEVMKDVVDRMGMTEVTIAYGMTETSPVSTQTQADDSLHHRVSTVGRVHPHVEVKIIDPVTGVTVPLGTEGELCTRGYLVMIGYWREPEKTAEAIDAARWMHSGDLATMDADGYVDITGRLKDMVIRGGENVAPREVEEFLHTHPYVQEAQVVGVPDARLGEELMAWLRLAPGAESMSAADVQQFASGRLARYKIPRYVAVVDEFPLTASGKVRKVELRQMGIDRLGLGEAASQPV